MRLFLIFDNHGAEVADIVRGLKKNSHEVLYWVGAPNREVQNFPEIIFHHYKDARLGIAPQRVDSAKYEPPERELVRKLYHAESMVMMIMNKIFPDLPFEERKHLYLELLRYWHGVLTEFQPDAIIFPLTPHSNYNYLIYELGKLMGIKTIMFSDTWISDRTFIHSDLWDVGPKLREVMKANSGRQFTIDDLNPDVRSYYLKQKGQNINEARPWYFTLYRQQYSGFNMITHKLKILAKNIFSPDFFRVIYDFFANRLGSNVWKEYRQFQVRPDYQRKYVFVPLQYQPERSTTPHGDIYADLIFAIETIAAALPEGWIAYVKEHPVQWWRHGRAYSPFRYPGYYEKIARIPNVFLVPTELGSYELIEHSQAVATVTGTPGWEAVLRGKPAVMLGYYWYRDCPYVFTADDVDSCRRAFETIKNNFQVREPDVINFLKSFDEATIRCYVDDLLNTMKVKVTELTSEQRINNLIKSVVSELHAQ
ncbi:MAG: hypothetical protein U1C57_03090 [Candidatus Doudnabacteria bacterium]|nr:hypothetical protein [Candidatus Doudnabacteria bacterium]